MKTEKRANGYESAVYLGSGRKHPWGARITLGKDAKGNVIRHFVGFFSDKLDALLYILT